MKINFLKRFAILAFVTVVLYCCTPSREKIFESSYFGKFIEIPLNQISPQGWLKQYLEIQKKGLTGYLDEYEYPYNRMPWAHKTIDSIKMVWWPWEQSAYLIDGQIRSGYLLQDTFLLRKAKTQIDFTINNPDSTGYLGPEHMKNKPTEVFWAHVPFMRAVMAEYEVTRNPKILTALTNHYLKNNFDLCEEREQINIENMLWLYGHTNNKAILEKAISIYKCFNKDKFATEPMAEKSLSDTTLPVHVHGVTFNEIAKLGAIIYLYTGEKKYLDVSVNAFKKLDKFYMMADGVNTSAEFLETPVHSLRCHETCDISDFTWSNGYLLMATGNPMYADKIEKAMFNAAPGAVSDDFRAVQYFSSTNQVIVAKNSNQNQYYKGGGDMAFSPLWWTECCSGNINRAMPNFIGRMWMKTADNGIVATMFGPSQLKTTIGDNNDEIIIEEKTNYPFDGKIVFKFQMKNNVSFRFGYRIPEWCNKFDVQFNASVINSTNKEYNWIVQEFKNGDSLVIRLNENVKVVKYPDNGYYIQRGALVYSLDIKEDWQHDTTYFRHNKKWPTYNVYSASEWNYALTLNKLETENEIKVITKQWSGFPWISENAPIEIYVPARSLKGWDIVGSKTIIRDDYKDKNIEVKGDFQITPPIPDKNFIDKNIYGKTVMIKLIPYGCAKLRITIFPGE